jgi:hypothetical protein
MRNDDGNCIYLLMLHPFYKIKSYKKYNKYVVRCNREKTIKYS